MATVLHFTEQLMRSGCTEWLVWSNSTRKWWSPKAPCCQH